MVPVPDWLNLTLLGVLAVGTSWNAVITIRNGPIPFEKTVHRKLTEFAEVLDTGLGKINECVDAEAERAISAQRVKNELVKLIEEQDDLLERVDTKRRRIDASEARARKKLEPPEPEFDPSDLAACRQLARRHGLM